MSKSKSKQQQLKVPQKQKITDETLLQRFGQQNFKGQNRLKFKIMDLETQNQVHRSKIFELNETVTKILDKAKIRKGPIPVLESQLGVVAQQLVNVEKLIEIYKKNLKALTKKNPATEQVQTIADSNLELKSKQAQLQNIRKQIKLLQNKNKGLQYKLNQYSKRGKIKSVDEQGTKMKEAIAENKILRKRLEQIQSNEKKREVIIELNYKSTKDLEQKVSALPLIKSSRLGTRQERSKTSMSRLQAEKKIYQKWFKTFIPKSLDKIDNQIRDFEKITQLLNIKIQQCQTQIQAFIRSLASAKQKINPSELQKARQNIKKQDKTKKVTKNFEVNCDIRYRTSRRQWVGKFDGLRFSDSRYIREEVRLYKVTHNNIGYYQFSYYSVQNHQKKYACDLPFPINSALKGKQSIFEVQYPDFIKTFKLRVNKHSSKIIGMELTSDLGMNYEFINALQSSNSNESQHSASKSFTLTTKSHQAPTLMFGSYSTLCDEKKNVIGVHLEGLGMQIIEDYVQEII